MKENIFDNPKRLVTQGIILGVGGYGLYWVGKKFINDYLKKNEVDKAADSPEVQQAMLIRGAMNPSGVSWLSQMDTTNTDSIMSTAKQITKLDEVGVAYRRLYQAEMLFDLEKELSAADYAKFLAIVSANNTQNNAGAATSYVQKNQVVVAKVVVSVRKTPDASYHGAWYESSKDNNIFWQAQAGTFIGYATGSQHYDEKNNVKFIQVAFLVKKENLSKELQQYSGKAYSMWVSSSSNYIQIFDSEQAALASYPNLAPILAYKKPLNYYTPTLKGIKVINAVVSTTNTTIYNENMRFIAQVAPKTLLGEYIGELKTTNKTLVKFRSVDLTECWVNKKDSKIITT